MHEGTEARPIHVNSSTTREYFYLNAKRSRGKTQTEGIRRSATATYQWCIYLPRGIDLPDDSKVHMHMQAQRTMEPPGRNSPNNAKTARVRCSWFYKILGGTHVRLNLPGLEPRVLAGQSDVVHALALDAGELVEHVAVEVPHHLGGEGRGGEGRVGTERTTVRCTPR